MKRLFNDVLSLLYPRLCAGCKTELLSSEGEVCLTCLNQLQLTDFHLTPQSNEFFYRIGGLGPVDGAMAMYYFDKKGLFQSIISDLKYNNRPKVGESLGFLYAQILKESGFDNEVDYIVPVPLHPARKRQRGYNQSQLIGEGLSRGLGKPMVHDALIRSENTKTQTGKSRESRWDSLSSAFSMSKPLAGRILLVDDVVTTGSTLMGSAKSLFKQNTRPTAIYTIALGITRKE